MITKNQQAIIQQMKKGAVLWSSHPYPAGRKFISRLEANGKTVPVPKWLFFSMLDYDLIKKSQSGTNRQYQYILTPKADKQQSISLKHLFDEIEKEVGEIYDIGHAHGMNAFQKPPQRVNEGWNTPFKNIKKKIREYLKGV